MKVDLGNLEPQSVPVCRGAFYIRDTAKWGPIAQAWPRKKVKRSQQQKDQNKRFAFAAIMAANPIPTDYQTAVEMAKDTEQVPRDILTMAAMGQYYIIVNPDGTEWGNVPGATK